MRTAGVRSVQLPPWFRVIHTLPSSVPIQMTPAAIGDSEMDVIVQNGTFNPILLGSLVVRSGLISCQ